MKKLILLFLAGALVSTSANAQTPQKINKSMIGKATATWCPPCGGWGWTLNDEMLTTNKDKAFGISLYGSTSSSYDNDSFYQQQASTIATFITVGGWPTFSQNLKNWSAPNSGSGGVNTAGIKSDINAACNTHSAANVVASTGMLTSINGNVVTVKTKTKFWEAASGTYNVAVYLLEDGAVMKQASKSGSVEHHHVFRQSFTSNVWGKQIATGTIAKDAEYEETFTLDISTVTNAKSGGATWDKSKFEPVVIIYKMTGATPTYVNGNNYSEYPASVGTISTVNDVNVYPNPATSQATVTFNLPKASSTQVVVTDVMGRTVYNSGSLNLNAGNASHTINTANLANGMYNVTIEAEGHTFTKRISVAK